MKYPRVILSTFACILCAHASSAYAELTTETYTFGAWSPPKPLSSLRPGAVITSRNVTVQYTVTKILNTASIGRYKTQGGWQMWNPGFNTTYSASPTNEPSIGIRMRSNGRYFPWFVANTGDMRKPLLLVPEHGLHEPRSFTITQQVVYLGNYSGDGTIPKYLRPKQVCEITLDIAGTGNGTGAGFGRACSLTEGGAIPDIPVTGGGGSGGGGSGGGGSGGGGSGGGGSGGGGSGGGGSGGGGSGGGGSGGGGSGGGGSGGGGSGGGGSGGGGGGGTCKLETTNVSVLLPTVNAGTLRNAQTPVGLKSFNLVLTGCAKEARPMAAFLDVSNIHNSSTNLGASSSSTTKGVALRLRLVDGNDIAFGSGNAKPLGMPSDTGVLIVPMQSYYVATDSAVKSGKIYANALLQISFP
ncbi:fimbrial protein [Burkholderia ubonensis]|uniref:fimbrial protein n=1 Tax=Burkholderia ubonensis TaxID=101571 RepID=UPI000AFD9182|nr:fimbrial protein [Burkholderia ubonensis]